MLRRMGPLQGVLKMIPGLGKQLEGLDQVDERQLAQVEAIILSMTPHERRVPHVIDGSRRKRIAAGSGTTRRAGEPADRGPKADGEDDEDDGIRQDALAAGHHAGRRADGAGGKPRPSATRKSSQQAKEESEEVNEWQ